MYSESRKSGDLKRESVSVTSHKFSTGDHLLALLPRDWERGGSPAVAEVLLIGPVATDKPDSVYGDLAFIPGVSFNIFELDIVHWGFFTGCRCSGGAAPAGVRDRQVERVAAVPAQHGG